MEIPKSDDKLFRNPPYDKLIITKRLSNINIHEQTLYSVRQEMVDLGSGQGRSDFATAVVAALRRGLQKSENADLERKMPFIDGHYPAFPVHAPPSLELFFHPPASGQFH